MAAASVNSLQVVGDYHGGEQKCQKNISISLLVLWSCTFYGKNRKDKG